MKKNTLLVILLSYCFIIGLIIIPKKAIAFLKINEIFPRPSPGVDWVEIYNPSEEVVDLSNYTLTDAANNKITFSCFLNPKGFVSIDWGNNLNNAGDTLRLKKGEEIIDCVSYGNGANQSCDDLMISPLPTPGYNQSLARVKDGDNDWVVLPSPTKDGPNDGSQKSPEAICIVPTPIPSPSPTPTPPLSPTPTPQKLLISPTITPTPLPTISPISYDNIYLSEVMVYPETGEKEWVEIYNDNDYPVYLQNWYLDDIENAGSSPKMFSLEIAAKSYGVYEITTSMFNNSGDNVRLLDFNKVLKDSFEYANAIKGKSYGRTSFLSDEFCLQEPTKGSINNSCLNPTSTLTLTPTSFITKISSPTKTSTITPVKMIINDFSNNDTRRPFFLSAINNDQIDNGQILSSQSQLVVKKPIISKKPIAYVKGFVTSSFIISLLNIFYLVHRIIKGWISTKDLTFLKK